MIKRFRQDKTLVLMLLLTLLILLIAIFLPYQRQYLSYLLSAMVLVFAFQERLFPYFFVIFVLVSTQFGSLVGTMDPGTKLGFQLPIVIGTAIILIKSKVLVHKSVLPILIMVTLCMISVVVAHLKFKQSFYAGFNPFLIVFIPFFLSYPLAKSFFNERIYADIINFLISYSVIDCLILCFRYFVIGPENEFSDIVYTTRYTGEAGILIHAVSPMLCFAVVLVLAHSYSTLVKFLVTSIVGVTIVFVSQTRIFILLFAVTLVVQLFINNSKIPRIVKFLLGSMIAIVGLLFFSDIASTLAQKFFGVLLQEQQNYIRFKEINWFWNVNQPNKLLGIGMENRSFLNSPYLLGVNQFSYYISDLGIIGFFLEFGIQGVLGLVIFISSMIKKLLIAPAIVRDIAGCVILLVLVGCASVSPVQFVVPLVVSYALLIRIPEESVSRQQLRSSSSF